MNTIQRPLKLLLAEDDAGDVFLLRELLAELEQKIELNVVENGLLAMAYLRKEAPFENAERPDLMLLDLNMPRMDGRQVLAEIRQDDTLSSLPILVLTTSSADADIDSCYELGGNAYLQKPSGLDAMQTLIRRIGEFWGQLVGLPFESPPA